MKTKVESSSPAAVTGTPLIWLRLEGAAVFILSILLCRHFHADCFRFRLLFFAPDISLAATRLGLVADSNQLRLFALIWIAHIGMDRAGFGVKYLQSFFQPTHLG